MLFRCPYPGCRYNYEPKRAPHPKTDIRCLFHLCLMYDDDKNQSNVAPPSIYEARNYHPVATR